MLTNKLPNIVVSVGIPFVVYGGIRGVPRSWGRSSGCAYVFFSKRFFFGVDSSCVVGASAALGTPLTVACVRTFRRKSYI